MKHVNGSDVIYKRDKKVLSENFFLASKKEEKVKFR